MNNRWVFPILLVLLLSSIFVFQIFQPEDLTVFAQAPTIDFPTVTSTPSGPIITVRSDADQEQINVRSGPSIFYDKVGVLLVGQSAPAKGRSAGGEWILVDYPGAPGGVAWVYAPLVNITPGKLPIVEPPPTPTPLVTKTIDPTLAAQFVITAVPTRLATYTPPPPLALPTFEPAMEPPSGGLPMGLVIILMAAIGIFIGLFTLAQRK